jgi:AraC-like DNA-binding protein
MERFADASTTEERVTVLDQTIASRIANARPASPAVVWAWRQIEASGGQVAIGALAGELGWSRKHLVARFREQIGLPPKAVARIVRFQRALAMLRADIDRSSADVAYATGYYDQAHLINEFVALSGQTPSELVRTPR